MGADSSAQNTPNAPKFICPSPKVWDFDEKNASLGVCSPCPLTNHYSMLSIFSFDSNVKADKIVPKIQFYQAAL